ncbi:MAG: glutathione S-transferase [Gammaproteobacteria bacterium]|nr:glutathione S-transferase [Gammaproteobacteria bacterium]
MRHDSEQLVIDLHTVSTANGYKVSIMLEELALPYRVVSYDLPKGENLKPELLALNRVGRLPVIVDHDVDGEPLPVYGSAAILQYLAEKSGRFMPTNVRERAKVIEWMGIISSDLSPAYSGQFVFNVVAKEKQPWAIAFYDRLCARLIKVMDDQLASTTHLAGAQYSIADILAYPVAAVSMQRFPGTLDGYPNIARWASTIAVRPAVQRGLSVPS